MAANHPSTSLNSDESRSASPSSGEALARNSRETSPSRLLLRARKALGVATLAYGVLLVVLMTALHWQGEHLGILSLILYAPAPGLLLPLLVLSPLSLLLRPRLLAWHTLFAIIVFFIYMGFHWAFFRPKPTASTVTAVTFNFGDSSRTQFLEFLVREKPDLIVLQDARGRSVDLAQKIPGMQTSELGQFVLLSRFPIRSGKLVDSALAEGRPIAARWEVTIQDRDVAVYSVHLPTPRRELSQFLGKRRVLANLIGYGKRQAGFGDYREWIHDRIELARSLVKVFAAEQKPMIVGGDFNTPDHGYIYHLFAGQMTDAFANTGRGWGFTFPGSKKRSLSSLAGPWLRLDYFFTGHGWKAIECRPEPGVKSQHKAVLARFEPVPMP
jgi:endonuclease/exonuclease/phosphatase (EEP) superfamily protein YafD